MRKTEKIFRDPLYNYVVIDRTTDEWLVELLNCREVQRLRRIHQLGVSHYTYPGADHSRLSHTLGVLHLMQQAWKHLQALPETDPGIERAKHPLLAAAVLHDVGHGPFSHLFEPCLGVDHEQWSRRIICDSGTEVYDVLDRYHIPHDDVATLIEKGNVKRPPWQKNLLSSELDVDRLDYLRRDSLFTGAGYGHFDWYRILHSFKLHTRPDGLRMLVWADKAKFAIEEYIFARFYMYNNVYQHKTTRGFEKLLHAAWDRAKQLAADGKNAWLVREVEDFLTADDPSVQQYLALEDATLLYQLQVWTTHPDKALSDLASRFLRRKGFAMIEAPKTEEEDTPDQTKPKSGQTEWDPVRTEWEQALRELVARHSHHPPELYALRDDLKLDIYAPYSSEKEEKEQSPYNAIFIEPDGGGEPKEISKVLTRLKPFTGKQPKRFRYYVPQDVRDEAKKLRDSREW